MTAAEAPAAVRAAVEAHARGGVPAHVALARALLAGVPADAALAALDALAAAGTAGAAGLAAAARARPGGLAKLQRLVAAGADHAPAASTEAGVAAARAMFDRLVAVSPEASVAAYSLGDPALLAAATAELVDWLRGLGVLDGRPAVLDLGCGIGRLAAALAPRAGGVLGLDVSPAMIEEARRRHAGVPGLRFAVSSGHDLAPAPDAAFGLLLAVDVFPYLMLAGPDLAERHVAEAARALAPGGSLIVLNLSYRGDDAADRADLAGMAGRHGLAVPLDGARPLRLWDGLAFRLRRAP